jgi:hypothetical protein
MAPVGLDLLPADQLPLQQAFHGAANAVLRAPQHVADALGRERPVGGKAEQDVVLVPQQAELPFDLNE